MQQLYQCCSFNFREMLAVMLFGDLCFCLSKVGDGSRTLCLAKKWLKVDPKSICKNMYGFVKKKKNAKGKIIYF